MNQLQNALDPVRAAIEQMLGALREESSENLVEVVVEIEAVDGPPLRRKWAFVATRRVRFANGTGRVRVHPGTRHLSFDVQGRPGQRYRIAITAPESARFERTRRIPSDGEDGGVQEIEIR